MHAYLGPVGEPFAQRIGHHEWHGGQAQDDAGLVEGEQHAQTDSQLSGEEGEGLGSGEEAAGEGAGPGAGDVFVKVWVGCVGESDGVDVGVGVGVGVGCGLH